MKTNGGFYTNNNEILVDYMPKVDKMAQMTSPNYSNDVIRRQQAAKWIPTVCLYKYQILTFVTSVSFYSFRGTWELNKSKLIWHQMKNRIKDLIKVETKMTVPENSVFHNHLAQDQKWLKWQFWPANEIRGVVENDHLAKNIRFFDIRRCTYDMGYAELFALGLSGMHQN